MLQLRRSTLFIARYNLNVKAGSGGASCQLINKIKKVFLFKLYLKFLQQFMIFQPGLMVQEAPPEPHFNLRFFINRMPLRGFVQPGFVTYHRC